MTAYLVLAAVKHGTLRWDEQIAILRSDVDPVRSDEAKMHLVPGQHAPVRKLVEGLIAASANDAALVLARRVGGSVDGFETVMNETARTRRMDHSHFSTPSGITKSGNYSTARDLSILARRITTEYQEYYSFSPEQHFAYGGSKKRNKNWLLRDDPTVVGLKTGRTQAAGFCIVATAHRTQAIPPLERRVFAVILGAPTAQARISGAAALLNYGFSAFKDEVVTDPSS
jgi:serine-type D-Ala-D-Ala carboxypeptidase (penicillin-binding protein 5/6)